jgi:hypothetical protein
MNKGKRLQPEFALWASLGPASVALVSRRVNRKSRCLFALLSCTARIPAWSGRAERFNQLSALGSVYFP